MAGRARTASLPQVRSQRRCSRTGCTAVAVATLTYVYSASTAVVGPLATYAEPHSYDLCEGHGRGLTAPKGWEVVRHEGEFDLAGPSTDDLEVLADAVREAGRPAQPGVRTDGSAGFPEDVGRRGHLRGLPTVH